MPPTYKELFDEHGADPDDFRASARTWRTPVHGQGVPGRPNPFKFFATPMSEIRRTTRPRPPVVVPPGGLHRGGPPHVGLPGGPPLPDVRDQARDKAHNAYGYGRSPAAWAPALRRRAPGVRGDPDVRRADREAGAAIRTFSRGHPLHAHLPATIADGSRKLGFDPRRRPSSTPCWARSRGPRRCATRSRRPSTSPRATSTGCPRSWAPGVAGESFETKDGSHLGGPLPPEMIDRSTTPCCPRAAPVRAGVHSADQAGAADYPRPPSHDLTRLLPARRARPGAPPYGPHHGVLGRDEIILRGVNRCPDRGVAPRRDPRCPPHFTLEMTRPHRMERHEPTTSSAARTPRWRRPRRPACCSTRSRPSNRLQRGHRHREPGTGALLGKRCDDRRRTSSSPPCRVLRGRRAR
ncbi:hypothetical protein QJS66_16545 [Kocuria rhizophila]|nr:hypothetical protein QJS66_16545 [Kocuria rhizophila]